jgi:gas vesicle protein
MPQDSLASIVSGQDEREAAEQMHRLFSYLAQNPQQYQQARQHMIDTDQLDPEDLPEQMTPQQLAQAAQMLSPYAGPPGIGDMLAQQGRNGDTMMAHVNPQEMQMLQSLGGSGSINPATGMPEFFLKRAVRSVTRPVTSAVRSVTRPVTRAFRSVTRPLVGGVTGFLFGGPLGAAIGAGAGYTADQMSKARKSAEQIAAEEQRLFQEAENRRMAEAQAEAERIRQAEIRRQENIALGQQEISNAFGQFDDNFFNQRAQSFTDFAMPQLDRQHQDQMRQLTAALARSGNLNSSLRGNLMGQLQREYDTGKLSLADQARGFADQARTGVSAAQARLMESNAQLADPGTIRNSAMAEAQGLMANPQFQNLGQMLSNLSANVGPVGSRPNNQGFTGVVQLFNRGGGSASGRLVG